MYLPTIDSEIGRFVCVREKERKRQGGGDDVEPTINLKEHEIKIRLV